jgi:hypothetical protein
VYVNGLLSNSVATAWTDFIVDTLYLSYTGTDFVGYIYNFNVYDTILINDIVESDIVKYLSDNKFDRGRYKFDYDFSLVEVINPTIVRDDMLKMSLMMIEACGPSQTPNANDINVAADSLQLLIEELNNSGMRLWQVDWISLMTKESNVVLVDSISYRCTRNHTSSMNTKPGVGSNWRSVWEVAGTSTNSWAFGADYETVGVLPLGEDTYRLLKAYVRRSGVDDIPIRLIDYNRYHEIQDKAVTGTSFEGYVDYSLNNPVLYLRNYPSDTTDLIQVVRIKKLVNVDDASDTLSMEKRWYNAIIFKLAYNLSFMMGNISSVKREQIRTEAERLMKLANGSDYVTDDCSVTVGAY